MFSKRNKLDLDSHYSSSLRVSTFTCLLIFLSGAPLSVRFIHHTTSLDTLSKTDRLMAGFRSYAALQGSVYSCCVAAVSLDVVVVVGVVVTAAAAAAVGVGVGVGVDAVAWLYRALPYLAPTVYGVVVVECRSV